MRFRACRSGFTAAISFYVHGGEVEAFAIVEDRSMDKGFGLFGLLGSVVFTFPFSSLRLYSVKCYNFEY